MEVVYERCAAIDISKKDVKVCIRVPGAGQRRRRETRTFSTMTNDLLKVRDWLVAEEITVVGMEATGDYWKPFYYLLEDLEGVEVMLVVHELAEIVVIGNGVRAGRVRALAPSPVHRPADAAATQQAGIR